MLEPLLTIFLCKFITALSIQTGETIFFEQVQQRYALVPDANGQLHYIDLNTASDVPENRFVAEQDVVFRLFTRSQPGAHIIRLNDVATLSASSFNPSHRTR